MKKLMHLIMLSCLKATELIERKLEYKLNVVERVQLVMHKSMCKSCSLYEKQSELLENLLVKQVDDVTQDNVGQLKIDIISRLKK